jgi:hypothetical protein
VREETLNLLRFALNQIEYPMLRVSLSAHCIRFKKWLSGEAPPQAQNKLGECYEIIRLMSCYGGMCQSRVTVYSCSCLVQISKRHNAFSLPKGM